MAFGQSIETPATSYDAVIVGSGLGGATMALRLAQAQPEAAPPPEVEDAALAAFRSRRDPR